MNKIKTTLSRARFITTHLGSALRQDRKVDHLRFLFRGFTPRSVKLFKLDKCDPETFLDDFAKKRTSARTNRNFVDVLTNKLLFQRYLDNEVSLPTLFGILHDGILRQYDAPHRHLELVTLLKQQSQLVIKPMLGGGGRGVMFISIADDQISIDGEAVSRHSFNELASTLKSYLVYQRLNQHPVLDSIYPHSVNTTRVVTMRDPSSGSPFIAYAYQRFGVAGTAPRDHCSKGAIGAEVNIATGQLGIGVSRTAEQLINRHAAHPETGLPIEGVVLPLWHQVTETVLGVLERNPWFDYVGWDVLVGTDQVSIIEGNHNPGAHSAQMIRPMLESERSREFFSSRGIIS